MRERAEDASRSPARRDVAAPRTASSPRRVAASALVAAAAAAPGPGIAAPASVAWEPTTRSPQPIASPPTAPAISSVPATSPAPPPSPSPADAEVAALQARCGPADAALARVAQRNVDRQLGGAEIMPAEELAFSLRAAGEPHAWPRAWSLVNTELSAAEIDARFTRWLSGWPTLGARRCGVARGRKADGTAVVTVVAVDALADLSPLPTTARVGQWLTLEGTLLVPAAAAKVVLLGPHGAPRVVLSSLTGRTIRSSFAVDQPGPWLVQVLATASTGPRPVLEAAVFAGTPPPTRFVPTAAPGEEATKGPGDDSDAMLRMMNAARASEGLPPLRRDAALDALARAHSEEMMQSKIVGHDVGSGDPAARLAAAGYSARLAGENVASAATLEGAHRAIWASPSHRGNLLGERYTRTGVAVVRDPSGRAWVTELFAG